MKQKIALAIGTGLACSTLFAQDVPYVEYGRKEHTTEYVVPAKEGENPKQAQDSNSKMTQVKDTVVVLPNTISFHPLQMVDGTVALSYERANRKRDKALRLVLGYSKLDQANFYGQELQNFEQIYGEIDMKFFLTRKKKKAPVGLYAAPFFQTRHSTYDYHYKEKVNFGQVVTLDKSFPNLSSFSLAGGVMLGYNIIVLEMISIEVYSGVGIQSVNGDYRIDMDGKWKKPLETGWFYNNGPIFKLGASIGINF